MPDILLRKSFDVQEECVAGEREVKQRFSRLEAWLDERWLWATAESAAQGRGGISLVSRASGIYRRATANGTTPSNPAHNATVISYAS